MITPAEPLKADLNRSSDSSFSRVLSGSVTSMVVGRCHLFIIFSLEPLLVLLLVMVELRARVEKVSESGTAGIGLHQYSGL